jgi:Ni,Fe-hydrogenase III small subunit
LTAEPGARAAGRLASVLASAHEATRARLAPMEQAVKHQATEALMERWERSLAEFTGPFFTEFLKSPDIAEEDKQKLRSLIEPTHQTDFIIGTITAFLAVFGIAGAIQSGNVDKWRAWGYRHVPERRLSAEQAADGLARGILSNEQALDIAADNGLNVERFSHLEALAGSPPGPQELLQAYRRGIISESELRRGIRQSRVRNEWVDTVVALRYQPPGAATAIEAAVQNHLPDDQARRKAEEAGLAPENYQWLYELAGNPPGPEHMIDLMHRGAMTRAQVVAGYEERMLTRPDAISHLIGLGYDAEEGAFILDLADHAREVKFTNAAVGRFHTLYVRRRIDKVAVSSALDTLGIPAGQRDDLLTLWDLERTADTPDLTTAQWQGLFRRNVIDEDRFTAEMLKKGWSDEEANFLKYLAFPPSQSSA